MLRALRNFLIIAAIAFVLAEGPGGGNLSDAILAFITVLFIGLIGFALLTSFRENRLAFYAMSEMQRRTIVVALGAIALMVGGSSKLMSTSGGTVLWIAVIGIGVFAIVRTVVEARSL